MWHSTEPPIDTTEVDKSGDKDVELAPEKEPEAAPEAEGKEAAASSSFGLF